jgi:hypothetical protein
MALSIIERARLYLAKVEAPRRAKSDPQDSHALVFTVAQALVNGFELPSDVACQLLREYCHRSDSPWSEQELQHKLRQAEGVCSLKPRGWLLAGGAVGPVGEVGDSARWHPAPGQSIEKPAFDEGALQKYARGMEKEVDVVWLGNRSAVDPACIGSDEFLSLLYDRQKEKVLVFTDQRSQGDAVWPEEKLPTKGREGVWFLCQPVDGKYHPNPRQGNKSRRSEEAVLAWRYMVLESDEAPVNLWLGAVSRMPLPISAIYTSGKRSVHALIRVDAGTKANWDKIKRGVAPALVTVGGDPGALSAVRLTRLPCCWRGDRLQKLLYVNPRPDRLPIADRLQVRDVVDEWLTKGEKEGLTEGVKMGMRHYARRVNVFRDLLNE